MVEVLVTVAVVGILSALALGSIGRILPASRDTVAVNMVETLNLAVSKYVQIHGTDIREVAGDDASGDEEIAVLRALQWDSPTDPDPCAPYMRQDFNPSISASADDYRMIWNGEFFELMKPGIEATGLKVMFDASDLGQPVVFPEGFRPLSND